MDHGTCHACKAPYIKPNAKFCNKCGEKRIVEKKAAAAPKQQPPATPAPASTSTAASSTTQPSKSAATAANSTLKPSGTSTIKKTNTSTNVTTTHTTTPAAAPAPSPPKESETSEDSAYDMETLEADESDEQRMNSALSTLGPNGITPEMLQTSNAEELKKYKKGSLLGRGTYGSVYLGLLPDGSFHAVKTVELGGKTGGITPKELVSLSREINMMRRLVHKNLCTFKGVFFNSEDSTINMFMEYVGGGSLTSIVKKFKPLPHGVICKWTKQLLSGLLYLHSQRIIHRDIKGENLLVDTSADPAKDAQIKLVDFGAAKRLTDAVAQSRTVIGTPYWMAPEVVDLTGEGTGYSYKADVWSVGCTVAEMITGKPPWPSKANIPAAIMMIAQCESGPSEVPTEADGASPGCIDFMNKCFVKNPDDRPTVEDLMDHPWIKGTMQ